jgi:hypothetical protein
VDLSDAPISNQLGCDTKLFPRPLLRSDLKDNTPFLNNIAEQAPLFDSERCWFLQVNVFPGQSRFNSWLRMPMVGCRYDNRINIFIQ